MDSNTPSSSPADVPVIDMTRDTDINFWCQTLNITPAQLREAVQHAGHQLDAIQHYVRDRGLNAA